MTQWAERFAFDSSTKKIHVCVGKVEIGQHVHRAYRKIVADALAIDLRHVTVRPVTTATSPDDGSTVGSLSMQVTGRALHAATLSLRRVLLEQAATQLKVDMSDIILDGESLELLASGRRYSVFELPVAQRGTDAASAGDIDTALSTASSFRGERVYIQDVSLPGMMHARALRGRRNDGFETDTVRVVREGGFAALLATSEVALDLAWARLDEKRPERNSESDGPVTDWIQSRRVHTRIAGETTPIKSTVCVSASRPFLLHASIAPSCAIARFVDNRLEIWTHSQGIFKLRDAIAQQVGMDAENIIVQHVPSAGCYGHNAADDAAMDAVLVCLHTEGVPVRVAWSQQDEFDYAPVGAPMKVHVTADLADDGSITGWRQTIWSGPHGQRPGGAGNVNLLGAIERNPDLSPHTVEELPDAIGGGASRNAVPPYTLGSLGLTTHIAQDLPVRTSAIRGLGAQMNVVAIEATMDELAANITLDPLQFRLRHIADPRGAQVLRRLNATLEAAGLTLQDNEAVGIGYARYKGKAAYAGIAARVRLVETVELLDVWAVVDAGRIVDRSGALNQIEGGIIQAASWTLFEGVQLRDGYIDAEGWDDYPIMGWSETPRIHTSLVDADADAPSLGVGECMVGPVSAAIVNAVSKIATFRIADLPLTRERILAAVAAH